MKPSGRDGKNWRCNAKRRRWDSGWNRPPSADHDRTEIGVRKVRVRLATQVHSNLFGVVYVLDEPSAGLHPTETEALMVALDRLKAAGNSLFVVEHDWECDKACLLLIAEIKSGYNVLGNRYQQRGMKCGRNVGST